MDEMKRLSKNERRELKRQRRRERLERERKEIGRMKLKRIMMMIIPAAIVLAIGSLAVSMSLAESPSISVTPAFHDFGDVRVGGSAVSTTMDVSNAGGGDLVISDMDSSCGCTSASVIVGGTEGPRFTMSSHGTNPRDWSVTLRPGETAQLKIYYDPNVHRDFRGSVTRYVTLFSNDPINPQMRVTIEATQV